MLIWIIVLDRCVNVIDTPGGMYVHFLQCTMEAQFLANQLQLYYGTNQTERFALVRQFNHDPSNFDYNSVLTQLQDTKLSFKPSDIATSTDKAPE